MFDGNKKGFGNVVRSDSGREGVDDGLGDDIGS